MSTDEYVPNAEDAVDNYVVGRGSDDPGFSLPELRAEYGPEFDRFLARVRRDAARAERERIVSEVRFWASINHDGGYDPEGDLLTFAANDIERIPEETP